MSIIGEFLISLYQRISIHMEWNCIEKKKTLSMRSLNNTQMDLLQSVSVLQHPNEHLGDKPQKILDPAQFLSDSPFVHH